MYTGAALSFGLIRACRSGLLYCSVLSDAGDENDGSSAIFERSLLRFHRFVLTSGFKYDSIEFHHFCDASNIGYGPYSFVRTVNADGEIHVPLLTTKGIVTQLKPVTLPRLELASAIVASGLIMNWEFPWSNRTFGQTASLFWIISPTRLGDSKSLWPTRSKRCACIVHPANGAISICLNPADVISRWWEVKDLPASWTQGPEFMWRYKSEWSHSVPVGIDMLEGNPEVSASDQCGVSSAMIISVDETTHPMATLIRHYSSFFQTEESNQKICIFLAEQTCDQGTCHVWRN